MKVLQELFPEPGRLQFIYADLGDPKSVLSSHILFKCFLRTLGSTLKVNVCFQVNKIFSENAFDAVMHFAAVAYVGESTVHPLK